MTRFLLTPILSKILEGRGMRLICAAPQCIHENFDVNNELFKYQINISEQNVNEEEFKRKIKVAGYGNCPRCHTKTPITNFEYNSRTRKSIPICEKCGCMCKIVYIQYVVSKHRKANHYYYHDECWKNMYL